MPVFTFQAIGASHVSITGGTGAGGNSLSGVNQGDGSHLSNATLTLTPGGVESIDVFDSDSNFGDSDNSQRLEGTQTFDGVTYPDNIRVEAEYRIDLTDGTNTWTLLGLNFNTSSPSYGTVEGLVLIDTGGPPLPFGVPLDVSSVAEGPNFSFSSIGDPCFAGGTQIVTDRGVCAVETLQAGDQVLTLDNGFQPLIWVGSKAACGLGENAPVEFAPGTLGNSGPVRVSPRHRVLLRHEHNDMYFGQNEVFAAAHHLLRGDQVYRAPCFQVTWYHLLFDRHQVVVAADFLSESLYPGSESMKVFSARARLEISNALMTRNIKPASYGPTARPVLRRHEAALIASKAFAPAELDRVHPGVAICDAAV